MNQLELIKKLKEDGFKPVRVAILHSANLVIRPDTAEGLSPGWAEKFQEKEPEYIPDQLFAKIDKESLRLESIYSDDEEPWHMSSEYKGRFTVHWAPEEI